MARSTELLGTFNVRVLLVSWNYPPYGDGAEKQARLLAMGLVRHGASISVLTCRHGSDPLYEVVATLGERARAVVPARSGIAALVQRYAALDKEVVCARYKNRAA
jgi:Fe2+ transport system protein FeoA